VNIEDMSYLKERLKEIDTTELKEIRKLIDSEEKVFIVTNNSDVDSVFTVYSDAYSYAIKNNFDLRIKTYLINEKVEQ